MKDASTNHQAEKPKAERRQSETQAPTTPPQFDACASVVNVKAGSEGE